MLAKFGIANINKKAETNTLAYFGAMSVTTKKKV
jgi:hypothetical protein